MKDQSAGLSLGIKANLSQFILLIVINGFVGSLVGFYTLIPLIGKSDFGIKSDTVILSYVTAFGITKAFFNYYAGRLADKFGRRNILVLGWMFGIPVPILIILAPSYSWIIFANVLLGINQGLAWSMTVIMKMDLVGPENRGLAMGLNEFSGYLSVSITLLVSGFIAATYGLRPGPFYLGIAFTLIGLSLSILRVKETKYHAILEARTENQGTYRYRESKRPPNVFLFTTLHDRALSSSCLAGLVNNMIFGMSWGLFPLLFASHGLSVGSINFVKAFYPGVWGVSQLLTGPMSDRLGRKRLIVSGQLMQAGGVWLVALSSSLPNWIIANGLLGLGTALVYPSLLAAVGDIAHPEWRGEALGTYRFWRDIGYAVGAVSAGVLADLFNIPFAIAAIGWLAVASLVVTAVRMYETRQKN
jgi:MFS family permease